MDRWLVVLGSLVAALVVGQGAWRTREAQADRPAPRPPAVTPSPPAPAGVGDVLRGFGPSAARVQVPPGSRELDWAVLTSYEYAPGLVGLPDPVKALEGQVVTMRGFLMPLYEFDDIHEFVLVPNHMSCCFGVPAGLNAQVQVKIDAKRGLPNTNEPLEVTGSFRAVETKEQGYVLSIYRIDGAKVRIVGY
jgi:hypothetical protein